MSHSASPVSPTADDVALGDALLRAQQARHVESDRWTFVTDLDRFFQKVYDYYIEKGFWCLIISRVVHLLTLAFTITFSTFLMLFGNWSAVLNCQNAAACLQVEPFRYDALHHPTFVDIIIYMYFFIFCLYWCWHFLGFLQSIRDGLEMREFFQDQLNINDEELQSMEWSRVVERIVAVQRILKLCIVKDLNALDITNRILRTENYMIAFVNKKLLDLRIPWSAMFRSFCCCSSSQPDMSDNSDNIDMAMKRIETQTDDADDDDDVTPSVDDSSVSQFFASFIPRRVAFTQQLEWNVRFCVLNSMFDQEFAINSSFLNGAESLKRRFRTMAVINFLLMPFILIFSCIFFFLQHAQEFHEKKSYLGPRQWSPLAKWQLREFNELPHCFSTRLATCEKDATTFLARFSNRAQSLIAGFVGYVSGAIVAVLLLLTVIDSQLLVNLSIGNHPLFWHLAIFSGTLAMARSMTTDTQNQHVSLAEASADFAAVVSNTHYYPARWRANLLSNRVRREFGALYTPKVMVFVQEILGVLITPFMLYFALPASSERIVEFVRRFTVTVPGVGDVCGFANFDFSRFGDDAYQPSPDDSDTSSDSTTRVNVAASSMLNSSVNDFPAYDEGASRMGFSTDMGASMYASMQPVSASIRLPPVSPRRQASTQGKMEKSFLSFSLQHPKWHSPHTAASQLLASVAQLPQIPEADLSSSTSIDGSISLSASIRRRAVESRSSADAFLSLEDLHARRQTGSLKHSVSFEASSYMPPVLGMSIAQPTMTQSVYTAQMAALDKHLQGL